MSFEMVNWNSRRSLLFPTGGYYFAETSCYKSAISSVTGKDRGENSNFRTNKMKNTLN